MGLASIMVPLGAFKLPLFFWTPTIMMLWETMLTGWIQAFVFSLLTMIYLSGAIMAEEDH
jgi:F0F1-type ATP synthase membrane subunit a